MRYRLPQTNDRARFVPLAARGLVIMALVMIARPSFAQVIEIGPNGAAVTYSGPTRFTTDGVQTLTPDVAARPIATSPAVVARYIVEASERQQLNADLVSQVARRESGYRQSAVSNRDAVGVMQLTAGTARDLGVNRYDVAQNIHGGAAYLRQMLNRYSGDLSLALAAYNAGPGAVDRYHGVPPFQETQAYVAAILGGMANRSSPGSISLTSTVGAMPFASLVIH